MLYNLNLDYTILFSMKLVPTLTFNKNENN